MNRYVMEEFYRDPGLREQLVSQARRERARAIRAGFAWLVNFAKSRLTALRPAAAPRWIARLG